jgi:hypothetical protein
MEKMSRGRPEGSSLKARAAHLRSLSELAREHTADAIKALAHICLNGESESARVSAATAILDRGYGKPAQMVTTEISGPDGGAIEVVGRARALQVRCAAMWPARIAPW